MNWFYALNGKQAGPVTEEELKALYGNGTISANTLIWRQGMANWTPLSVALPEWVAPAQPVAETAGLPPSFAVEPVSTPTVPDNWISEEELLAGDYPVDIGGCISRGWDTFFKNPWTLLGGSLLAWVLLMAGAMVPVLGIFAQFVLYGPLIGGMFLLYLRQIRTGTTDVGLIFSAFGPRFVQHMLAYLVQTLIMFALSLPLAGLVFGVVMTLGLTAPNRTNLNEIWGAVGVGSITLLVIVGFIVWAASMALMLLWYFTVPLVADKGYDFWPAMQLSRKMVAKHFWWFLLFFLVLGLVSMLGMLACLIGLFVSLPVVFAALSHWYENIFGRLRPKTSVSRVV